MSSPASSGHSARVSRGVSDPGIQAVLVLQRDAPLERLDVRLAGEHEQVSDLFEVDLPARTAGEVAKCRQAALGDLDVQHIGELRADAAGRAAGRPAAELSTFDQHDLHAGLGEMKRGARADHPAADDDDRGGVGERRGRS